MEYIKIEKVEEGFKVFFEYNEAVKDSLREIFKTAKWIAREKCWLVGPRGGKKLEAWKALMEPTLQELKAAQDEKDEMDMMENEIGLIEWSLKNVNSDIEDIKSKTKKFKEIKAIFESKNAELVKARQTYEEEIETAKKAMDEAVELVKKVLDLDAVLEAHGKVKSKHRGGGTIDREAFRSAQRVIAKEHEKLLAIGYYSVGMDFIENANFNRPDRDDTSHIRMSDICTLKEYKKREEGE